MAYQLITDTRTAAWNTYRGKAEVCTWTFQTGPEQLDPIGQKHLVNRFIDGHVQALSEQRSQLLRLKVWRDTASIWTTNYRVETTATASPLWWNIIIAGILAIIALLIIAWSIKEIKEIDFGVGGVAEPIKWSAITVIALASVAGIYLLKPVRRKAKG